MSDGTETLDLETPDVPASGEVENSSLPSDDTSSDDESLESQTEDDGSSDDEDEELDVNGKKYRISKELKPLLMMQQDYTRKTQEVAENRKALEAEKEAIAQQAKAVKELNDDRKRLVLIDDYLEKQSKVDWNRLWQEDPLDTPRKWAEYQHWQSQRSALNSKISEAEQTAALEEERTTATRVQEALAEAEKIPGWKRGETGAKVQQHAQSYGLEVKDIDALVKQFGAPIIKMAHDAMLARQLIAKQQSAAKTPIVQPEAVKPLATVSKGKAPARSGLSDDMSAEEWVKARNQQLRNRK